MNITILNTVVSTQPPKKPGGKPYQMVEVAFKNNSFNGTVQGKKITSYSKAFNAVVEAKPGDTFDVVTEKNGEFVEWVSLTKAGTPVGTGSIGATPTVGYGARTPNGSSTGVGRSGFETPEERAKKQVYIIRQSSLATAAAVLAISPAKSGPGADAVIEMAKKFEAYVFGVPGLTGFEDVPDLDPSFTATEPQID